MVTQNRNRESVADIETDLWDLFECHSSSHLNEKNEPVIPGSALIDVLRIYGEQHDGVALLTPEEEDKFLTLLDSSGDELEVSPSTIINYIAALSSMNPQSPSKENEKDHDSGSEQSSHSESSSKSGSDEKRLPPNPHTPITRLSDSPFDISRRQRSTPLGNGGAPSSWNARRPAPAARRKSDAGAPDRALSDSESSFVYTGRRSSTSRSRPPSNPTSPRLDSSTDLPWNSFGPLASPPGDIVPRPHSRTQSHGAYGSRRDGYAFPQRNISGSSTHRDPEDSFDFGGDEDPFKSISTLPMPHTSDSDEESDGEDATLGLVHERMPTSSTASFVPEDRVEALQRNNADLRKRLTEAERTLAARLMEHENELEDLQNQLEEAKSELSATKREEKELRSKERAHFHQISNLENDIQSLQRSLDNARSSYQSLQKQYQEQCAESERYRNALRRRDQELKDHKDQISLHTVEIQKAQQQRDISEVHASELESQLTVAREAQIHLDEQKQENLMLKETIDRLRYDMDELRSKAESQVSGGSSGGAGSAQGSISKSLGLEILRMNNGKWIGEEEEDDEEDDETAVDEEEAEDTEGEDVVQTIITRRRKKLARKETIRIEETKEYCDASVQHDTTEFSSSSTIQTDPLPERRMVSFTVQTDLPPSKSSAVQATPPPAPAPPVKVEMEIQTDDVVEVTPSRSPSPAEEMTSSSSTVLPATPKAGPSSLRHDLPPSYSQIVRPSKQLQHVHDSDSALYSESDDAETRRDIAVVTETLRKWHNGIDIPFRPLSEGVSEDVVADWQAIKEELGVDCLAIDKVIEISRKTGPSKSSKDARRKSGRFYNIYNTYVYGNGSKKDGEGSQPGSLFSNTVGVAQTILIAVGLGAIGVAVLNPSSQTQYGVPGGPTPYDRQAWMQFNSMTPLGEGYTDDGTAAVWNFIGRVGQGAARMASGRAWPS